MGSPELLLNSLKNKLEEEQKSGKIVKKPKRAKQNYLPSHPPGETDDTLENLRQPERKRKKDSVTNINYMMARTYSWRRQEVVAQSLDVAAFKERSPALFEAFQVNYFPIFPSVWIQVGVQKNLKGQFSL